MSLFTLEAWDDVVPIEQDDGPTPVAAIKYSAYYKQMMDIFRGVVSSGEYSERVLDLTKSILAVNAANYTVWQYRRECLFAVGADLGAELDYMDSFSEDNPKNYQIWHHRRVIAEHSREGQREMAFTTTVFGVDAKNYHGWAHRQWVLRKFQLWDDELDIIDKLLQDDIRNNSVWNQRWFVVHNGPTPFTVDVFTREVEYAFRHIATARDNESAWNYLRGLVLRSPSDVPGVAEKNSILLRLKEDCSNVNESDNTCRHLYALTAEMCEKLEIVSDYPVAVGLWTKLAQSLDCIRKKYWLSRIDHLAKKI